MAGTFTSNTQVTLNKLSLPEFHRKRSLLETTARVIHAPCCYDLILGRNIASRLGLIVDFKDHTMEWDGSIVTMRTFPVTPQPPEPTIVPVRTHRRTLI
jgi:hypothetical protein